jgi:HD-like signal output (HDOD) protein
MFQGRTQMDIKSLLDQPHKLPTVPAVTQRLIASFSDEDVAFKQIVDQISADPALSAKLLRLANSAYFHLSRTIGTVEDALHMLGFVMVRNLVLGNGMAAAFRNTKGMDLQQFWRYNLYAASAARWLAGKSGVNADLVFTVGLMGGIGQLQMHVAAPEAVLPLDKTKHVLDADRATLEKQTLGFHNGDVAAELAKLWNFPEPIVEGMRGVPDPLDSPEFSEAAACVHMGAWVARHAIQQSTPEQQASNFPATVARRLGISLELFAGEMPPVTELAAGLDEMLA